MQTNYYAFIYSPGAGWLPGQPLSKQPLTAHFEYMSRFEAAGKLVLGGGFLDGRGALGVLQVSSLAEAQTIVENDPAVKSGLVMAEVHPWFVTVARPIQKGDTHFL